MASITYRQLFEAVHSITNVENAYEVYLAEIRVHYHDYKIAEEENIPKGHSHVNLQDN